ncbi:MAG TPA: response regulator [Armatimonadota bacterium]|nr:response regulator [Armatimonadota bacterium]
MNNRILVVDDEQDIRQLVALIMEAAGYEVVQAANGMEGLRALEEKTYDLVILDIMMPEMDGWEVCRHIKNQSQTKDIPVLILTVRSQPLDKVIGMEVVHANDYLTKPFERRELLDAVERLITKKTASTGA